LLTQVATLRAESLRKLINGLREKDGSLVREAGDLQDKADRLIDTAAKDAK